MIKKIKLAISSLVALAMLSAPVLAPAAVGAQSFEDTSPAISQGLCAGSNLDATNTSCSPSAQTDATDQVNNIIKLVINIFSLIVGVASVIMIIIGGLRYIISGGDSGNVTSAKNTILYAIIGLVVVALAQIIVQFVLNRVASTA